MVTKLADDERLETICAEGYSTVIDGRMSFKLSVGTVSRMLLRSLAHVGLERDRPHTAEADSNNTAFQGHPTPKFALPPARALK